jgi:hypothetical protein
VEPDWTLDVRIAPEGALSRVSGAINKRKKRLFGVLKVEKEFVGRVADGGFEIWERQQRAIHAVAQIRARRGGSRIEVRFLLPLRTRILLAIFFALYLIVAAGIALEEPATRMTASQLAITIGGALVLAAIFTIGARFQRTALREFVERLFSDVVGR